MKRISKIVLALVAAVTLFGCKNQVENIVSEERETALSETIILGEKKENPFSMKLDRALTVGSEPNYYYFRLRTDEIDKLNLLKEQYDELSIIPFDYEVIEGGCVYENNLGDEKNSPWFYFTLPVNEYLLLTKDYETEILEQMYVPDDYFETFDDEEEGVDGSRLLWSNYKKVKPCGYVKVWDSNLSEYVPVPNAKVTIAQWCHIQSVYTNSDGYYKFNNCFSTAFQNTANVKVTFENTNGSIFDAGALISAFYVQGDKEVGSLSENTIILKNNTKQFEYGTILRAGELYRQYAKQHKVTDPGKIKFWRNSGQNGSITFMSSEVFMTTGVFTGAFIGAWAGGLPGIIIGSASGMAIAGYLPDIAIGTKGNLKSADIINSVFHEMAHASHYRGIGSGRIDYWLSEYLEMLGGWTELLLNGKNPGDDCYNGGKSKLVCLVESWGYFYGDYLTQLCYLDYAKKTGKNESYVSEIISNYLKYLNYGYEKKYFFYNDALYKLVNKKSYTINDVFVPLKDKNTDSAETYIYKLYEKNKEKLTLAELQTIISDAGTRPL